MGTRRRVRRMHLNKLTKKNQKRMIDHADTYNNRWHSKNRTHQAILSYINSYKYDIDGIYTMPTQEFNKLMKPYRRIKKYIFVVPEDKLHDVLNHEYDLDKNIPKLEILLKKAQDKRTARHLEKLLRKTKYKRTVRKRKSSKYTRRI